MKFSDWYFLRVFLPLKRKQARTRVLELVKQREDAYNRLMGEIKKLEREMRD
jgi:hypothetical protein